MKSWMPLLAVCIFSATVVRSQPHLTPKASSYFYVYADKGAKVNHYVPSGWMGDYGDLKIDDTDKSDPADGLTAIKWTYTAKASQGANWAGVYWQTPPNNWGEKAGGNNLTGYKRLTFWARGANGNETLTEVKVGGITGEHGDSDAASIGPVKLTKEWKKYTIDLAGLNLANIIGAFAWVTNADNNPDGMTFWLDEVRFEK